MELDSLGVSVATDKLLKPGKLAEMSVGGSSARLTLPRLAKDDEGLYTLRIFTKDGTAEHSAYLFVSGATARPLTFRRLRLRRWSLVFLWDSGTRAKAQPSSKCHFFCNAAFI